MPVKDRLDRYQGLVFQRWASQRQAWQIPRTGIPEISQSETGLADTKDLYSIYKPVRDRLGGTGTCFSEVAKYETSYTIVCM